MIPVDPSARVCRNDGCARRVEPGEVYCAECGLERSLFRRDARLREADRRARRAPAAGR